MINLSEYFAPCKFSFTFKNNKQVTFSNDDNRAAVVTTNCRSSEENIASTMP